MADHACRIALAAGLSAPSLGGATQWQNSGPLCLAELRGHVVLVNFWTLTCINWLRTAPYIRAWADTYRDVGLVVVGVHTPEFSFERDTDLVRGAVQQRALVYPVAVDNDYKIWRAFHNRYWPALYFINPVGAIDDHHAGEGRFELSERLLQRLLGVTGDLVSVQGGGVEAPADWNHLSSSETYLGYGRTTSVGPAGVRDRPSRYREPADLAVNHWALGGEWTISAESVALEEPNGRITLRFHARDAHLVLSPSGPDPVPFRVLIDGRPPALAHGVDVDEDGHGVLTEGRLYQLVRTQGAVHDQTLQITFLQAGVLAYAFNFG